MKLLIRETPGTGYIYIEILDRVIKSRIKAMHKNGNFNQIKTLALSKGNPQGLITAPEAANTKADLIISGRNFHTDLT